MSVKLHANGDILVDLDLGVLLGARNGKAGIVEMLRDILRDETARTARHDVKVELLGVDAALDVLRRADPMPKFPKALERSRLSVTLPIDFSLITD